MSKKKPDDGYSRSLIHGEGALHVYVREDLLYRFAVLAVKLSISQKDIITDFIEEWLKENEKKQKKDQGPRNKESS